MSIRGFSTNTETLLFLAWAARTGLQETMKEVHNKRPQDALDRVLRAQIESSQPPFFKVDSVYGPLYEALFAYRLDQVDFQLTAWALRGYNAVYLKEADTANEACTYSTPETGILWESITQNESLLFCVKRVGHECNGEIRKTADALRSHFAGHLLHWIRSPESSFLFQEFIDMSLRLVNWMELAALVLTRPYQREEAEHQE